MTECKKKEQQYTAQQKQQQQRCRIEPFIIRSTKRDCIAFTHLMN